MTSFQRINLGITKALSLQSAGLRGISASLYNAVFSFVQYFGETTCDQWGNELPSQSSPVILEAVISRKRDPDIVENPGSDRERVYYEGFLTKSNEFDGDLPDVVAARIKSNNIWQEGKFYFLPVYETSIVEHAEINQALGQRIQGHFVKQEG